MFFWRCIDTGLKTGIGHSNPGTLWVFKNYKSEFFKRIEGTLSEISQHIKKKTIFLTYSSNELIERKKAKTGRQSRLNEHNFSQADRSLSLRILRTRWLGLCRWVSDAGSPAYRVSTLACRNTPTGYRYPSYPYKKDKDRREGKGRSCLRDRIDSSPCCASYFAPGWFKERGEFILFFISSRYNSSDSSYRPGAINPILHIVLVKVILFFKSSWYNSSYSSYRPGAINLILYIGLEK